MNKITPPDEERIAWHPAFYEAIQLELEQYKDVLTYEFERSLTEEPLKMDVLVIKKEPGVALDKNIAQIFLGHNIIEYKSPDDYVSVDDFYKVYSYAGFYKSLEKIPITDLTVSFVETRHPRDLLKHIQEVRHCTVTEKWGGIYHVTGDFIPIQIINSRKLAGADNLWLKNLRNDLDVKSMDKVFSESVERGKEAQIRAYLGAIMRSNKNIVTEVLHMGKTATLDEIFEETGFAARWEARGEARGEARILKEMRVPVPQIVERTGLSVQEIGRL